MSEPLVFDRFTFTYTGSDRPALDDVSLRVAPGEWLLVVGASGSGKSTLARAATGLVPHFYTGTQKGDAVVAGLSTREHAVYELYRHIALVFQNPEAQLFNASVENEIAFGLESAALPRALMRERIAWASEVMGLAALLGRAPHQLSGGEQQRVVVAGALALQPAVLLLDEPFAHLDAAGAQQLRAALQHLRALGTTVVVIEHRLGDLAGQVGHIALLYEGRVRSYGGVRAVLAQDIEGCGVALPYVTRLFRERGWDGVPLDVDEALALAPPAFMGEAPLQPARAPGPALATLSQVSVEQDGQTLLRGISFQIGEGEAVALLGRNGAGKTTLLKALAGLRRVQRGRMVCASPRNGRPVGLVFQNANDQLFLPSVREEIETGARKLKVFDPPWTAEVIETLGLGHLLDRSPFRLSEGEKKRVAIASTLAMRPRLIALDEPTVGQDESTRRALIDILRNLNARGHALVLTTHDLEFAEAVATRWLVLADGELIADDAPDAVMTDETLLARAGLYPTQRFLLTRALAARRQLAHA